MKKSLKRKTVRKAKRVVRTHASGRNVRFVKRASNRKDKFMPSTLPWEKSKQEWKNDWDDDFADFESDTGSSEY